MGQRRKEPLSLAGNDMVPERAAHAPALRLVICHGAIGTLTGRSWGGTGMNRTAPIQWRTIALISLDIFVLCRMIPFNLNRTSISHFAWAMSLEPRQPGLSPQIPHTHLLTGVGFPVGSENHQRRSVDLRFTTLHKERY